MSDSTCSGRRSSSWGEEGATASKVPWTANAGCGQTPFTASDWQLSEGERQGNHALSSPVGTRPS